MSLPYVIMALVTLQRLGELIIANRNTRDLRARGAIEFGRGHYPAMVAMHGAWLVALWLSVGGTSVNLPLLAVFGVLQALRVWVLATLGRRWTTRIIVLPGAELVRGGPFRFLRHPNYCVVVGEIAVLPLVFGLTWIAVLFSLLNAAMLWVRIGAESRALYGLPVAASEG
ncbi:isoprenylcysteine carboxylmethyltransferase family protein [Novosphingobium sp. Chol11]|uniref:isoprenylcysteine carboxyl methyltransferase family protein n=1 Tax=Novosphingobium sp. Chol11 TaxID=1385763 RepID=UPI0025ECA002|nr:isoprenylcysteine carboxylmethyltransferase family protein [Novosphingobium sp. Chol11]